MISANFSSGYEIRNLRRSMANVAGDTGVCMVWCDWWMSPAPAMAGGLVRMYNEGRG